MSALTGVLCHSSTSRKLCTRPSGRSHKGLTRASECLHISISGSNLRVASSGPQIACQAAFQAFEWAKSTAITTTTNTWHGTVK